MAEECDKADEVIVVVVAMTVALQSSSELDELFVSNLVCAWFEHAEYILSIGSGICINSSVELASLILVSALPDWRVGSMSGEEVGEFTMMNERPIIKWIIVFWRNNMTKANKKHFKIAPISCE